MLLLISIAIDGDNDLAASLMILGPMPSSPVDFETSKVLICNKTCSWVPHSGQIQQTTKLIVLLLFP